MFYYFFNIHLKAFYSLILDKIGFKELFLIGLTGRYRKIKWLLLYKRKIKKFNIKLKNKSSFRFLNKKNTAVYTAVLIVFKP